MDTKENIFESLLERVQDFSKISLELIKLKSIDKTATVSSILIFRLYLAIVLAFFILSLNIAFALWLGDIIGKNYWGFLIVASFYGLIGIVLFFVRTLIKTRINNSIITQLLN